MCYANIYYIMHRNIIIIIIILFKSGNKAHNIHRRHTDRQTDSISKRKKSNTRCTIKHNKTHKNADGHTHRSNFTISLL